MADIGGTTEEQTEAHKTMGMAFSRLVLHELGHDLGLEHTKDKTNQDIISDPQHIMDFRQNLGTSATVDDFAAVHFTGRAKKTILSSLRRRLKPTAK